MKKFKLFFMFFIILISGIVTYKVKAQSGNYRDFLPLQIGNIWVYQCTTNGSFCGGCSGRTRIVITHDTAISGKNYYKNQTTSRTTSGVCNGCGNIGILPFGIVRFDSLTANVFQSGSISCQYSPGEMMLDSFKAKLNDTIRMNCLPPSQWFSYICRDTNNVNIFGSNRQARFYNYQGFEGGHSRRYAKRIGMYFAASYGLEGGPYSCNRQMTLMGCVINGVVYGDTSMLVGVQSVSVEIPTHFSLSQNYPNPFNPSTKIQFALPKSSFASIVVYDVLSKAVETIVNEELNTGTYEVEWNAVNYPSGVYYYKLSAGDYTETKKMVLLR